MPKPSWTQILPGIWLYRDSCLVYAIEAPAGMVCINAGTGQWLDAQDQLPLEVKALLCTHYFRDHSAGAVRAAKQGIAVYVPEIELELFADPDQHFRQRETYIVYDNIWDLFSPIEPIPITGRLQDYDTVQMAGKNIEVIPLPGVTPGHLGLRTTSADGRTVVFSGELIHSPGRMARIAPLQYGYNNLSGALSCYHSVETLQALEADALLPSLGEPILEKVPEALTALKENLWNLMSARPWMTETITARGEGGLERVTDHVWLDKDSEANTWYILSESGKVMAIDYGYALTTARAFPGYPKRDRRRALLHGLQHLKRQFGVDRIEVVLVSHFHDDHVCGIPVLQRLHGTECWAAENFADLLEHPEAHMFPCNWPVASRIDRRLPLNVPFEWEEYTFHLAPMSGHTRFASLIGFESDGMRFAHTGDQYFFEKGVESFENNQRSQNHVYRNGALLDGYRQSGKWMLDWRPDIVLQGHQPAMVTDDHFFRHISEWTNDYADLASAIMPLGEQQTHFNLDSWGGWIWPYRTHLPDPARFGVTVTVRNPLPVAAALEVALVGPEGWLGESNTTRAAAHAEASLNLSMLPPGPCRRQPIAATLTANGQPFGQVCEALVTIGGNRF